MNLAETVRQQLVDEIKQLITRAKSCPNTKTGTIKLIHTKPYKLHWYSLKWYENTHEMMTWSNGGVMLYAEDGEFYLIDYDAGHGTYHRRLGFDNMSEIGLRDAKEIVSKAIGDMPILVRQTTTKMFQDR